MAASFGKIPTTYVRRLISPFKPPQRIGRVQPGPVFTRNVHLGQHITLGVVPDRRSLR